MRDQHTQKRCRKTPPKGEIRIIGGKWRGRKLPVLNAEGLRPTTDRIKETLFNWLMPVIRHAHCLDCYAGSGALGFEALSRGAATVMMLEKNRSVYRQLKDVAQKLSTDNLTIVETDALVYLDSHANMPFNIIFIDPPYGKGLASRTLSQLEHNHWLAEESWIYIETEQDQSPLTIPENWQLYREKQAGQVTYRLFRRTKIT